MDSMGQISRRQAVVVARHRHLHSQLPHHLSLLLQVHRLRSNAAVASATAMAIAGGAAGVATTSCSAALVTKCAWAVTLGEIMVAIAKNAKPRILVANHHRHLHLLQVPQVREAAAGTSAHQAATVRAASSAALATRCAWAGTQSPQEVQTATHAKVAEVVVLHHLHLHLHQHHQHLQEHPRVISKHRRSHTVEYGKTRPMTNSIGLVSKEGLRRAALDLIGQLVESTTCLSKHPENRSTIQLS